MSIQLRVAIVIMSVALFTSCAIPVKGGGRLYIMGGPQIVVVTNNTVMIGDLYENGEFLTTLHPVESYNVELGFVVNTNKILVFKAFKSSTNNSKVYLGMDTRTFYVQSGSSNNQDWVISHIDPVR